MQTAIRKWGNSASIRIPVALMEAVHVHLNDPVNVYEENGRIVIEPVCGYVLEKMLAAITPDNLHAQVDFGKAVGQEVF